MKTVKDIDGGRGLFSNDGQVGFPHVAAHKSQLRASLRPGPIKKSLEGLGGTVGTDPQQPPFSLVKLIHQGDKLVFAFSPADFIAPDHRDAIEIAMHGPLGDRHFHQAEDIVLTGFKDRSHLLPAQPFAPDFAHRPRQLFDLDATGGTLYPSRRVEEKDRRVLQGNKGQTSDLQRIVAGPPLAASGTDGFAASLGPQRYHQCRRPGISPSACVVDKSRLPFETVHDNFYAHPVCLDLKIFLRECFSGKIRQDAFYEKRTTAQGAIAGIPDSVKAKPFGAQALGLILNVLPTHSADEARSPATALADAGCLVIFAKNST